MSDDYRSYHDLLLDDVVSVLRRAEPVPAVAVAVARSAYAWRSVAAAVADLEFDSAVDDDHLARVRSATAERVLRFRNGCTSTELSVIDGRRLAGRLQPADPGSVVLRHPGHPDTTAGLDAFGHFMFDGLAPGPMSVRYVPSEPGRPGFQTEWVTV